ncbi:MFS transporter [Limosilactobacillus antri]|uniref:Major facilitator superfamily transporter permease n=1 Tax=Limosilactobacillus antri DSM 16041 TaxID=525309 RepID=C8P5R2_9LACO|nr:MFS transporter [Limosilactobacillus antri]EEW54157.1 transporter, major facilitator family protein [Limosilactobacillus antri DSM 16041]KRK59754.1 major facilitator superfamily transporter permease [Limosilactobacillus antri DSM 16041]
MNNLKKDYKKAPVSPVHRGISLALILGQIACGYALGISGTALAQAQSVISLGDFWVGLIGAGSLIGLAGSAIMGKIADRFGRKGMLMVNMYLFSVLSLLQLVTTSPWLLLLLRILIGLMIAIDYTVGNAWLVEWMPEKVSGRFQSHLIIYWTVGFIGSYIAGTMITGFGSHNWQVILASSVVPGLITALYRSLYRLPASPSWVATHVDNYQAQQLVQEKLGGKWGLSPKLLKSTAPARIPWKTLFNREYRRQTLVGGLFYACQAFAFFGISIFLPILLSGMSLGNGQLSGIIYNLCVLVGVLAGSLAFKLLSRRAMLLACFFLPALALVAMILGSQLTAPLQVTIFAFFATTLSAGLVLDYPYPTELFDLKVRATGVGACITISRIGAASGTFLLPILTNRGGAQLAMLVCAAVLVVGGLICLVWAPETSPRYQAVAN